MKISKTKMLLSFLIILFIVMIWVKRTVFPGSTLKEIWLFGEYLKDTLYPPKDLYDPLVNKELDISKEGLTERFEFKNKYVGRHKCKILLENFSDEKLYFIPSEKRYKLQLKLEIKFYLKNNLVKSYLVEDQYDPFIGKNGSGFEFILYSCPEDLLINKLITCEVKIIKPDKYLFDTYGPVKFYIGKSSDK